MLVLWGVKHRYYNLISETKIMKHLNASSESEGNDEDNVGEEEKEAESEDRFE